jgi:hypothetical protein
MRSWLYSIAAVLISAIPALGAQQTAGIDFNQTGSLNQSGFFAFNRPSSGVSLPSSDTFTTDWGNLTVTLFSGFLGNFNRGGFTNGGAFTYADLLNDFTYNNGPATLRFQLSGSTILPNSSHPVTLWAVDPHAAVNPTVTIAPTAGSGTLGGTAVIVDDASTPTDNSSFSTTLVFTANNSGVIDFSVTGDTPRINGLLVGALPEPGTLGLLMLGGLFFRRSRRIR